MTYFNLDQIIEELKNMFGGSKHIKNVSVNIPKETVPKETKSPLSKAFQAPIKGNFANSGIFSPNKATDARHSEGHKGVDLRVPGGTSIYPLASGIVTQVFNGAKSGNSIIIKHDNGLASRYYHLGTINVHKDDNVNLDTVIGTVGNTGNASSTFPHLHFEIWANGMPVNPAGYFSIPAYSDLTPKEKQQPWLSGTKEIASNFNLDKHVQKKTKALSKKINRLEKIATLYYKIVN